MSAMSKVIPFPQRTGVEPELLEALRVADPGALAQVYRAHHQEVRAFARRMLSCPTEAEDVVHDVFVALPRAMERFRGEASLKTLLISIAVHLCRRRFRSGVRRARATERMEVREVSPSVPTPESEARRRRLAESLRAGLATLSVEHCEVFVLCAVEERGSPEVAEILDIPEGTVRTRLFHARRKLRRFFEERGHEAEAGGTAR